MLKIAKSISAVLLLFVGGLYFLLYNPSSNTSTTFHYNQPKQTDTVIPTSTSSPTETTKSIAVTISPLPTAMPTPTPTILQNNTPTLGQSSLPTPPPGFKNTIFDDEFNGTSLDTTKWNIESQDPGGSRSCCSLHQSTYFTPQDVSVGNGNLVLETEKRNYNGYNYTTGMIQTQNLFAFQYGRIDIRAKLPGTQGIWPGFWMLPPNEAIPAFEIDIMELLGQDPHTVYMTNHWGSNQQQCWYTGPDFTAVCQVLCKMAESG